MNTTGTVSLSLSAATASVPVVATIRSAALPAALDASPAT